MKTFYASVECAERGLDPMKTNLVVADENRGKGAICLAISAHMKQLGIKNRCRLFEIPKDIEYIIAKPRMKKYIEYSANIYEIYLNYFDKNDIHVYSIDECFIDVTKYLKLYKTHIKDLAKKLMDEIHDKLKIPCTVGIGTNMFLAKVALDITAKHSPNFIGFLDEEKFKQTLWHHTPITDFWNISTGISERLKKFGIYDLYGVAHADKQLLFNEFGINSVYLIDHANGIEPCTIKDIKNYKTKSKSMSTSQVLPKNYFYTDALLVLKEMVQNAVYELFKEEYATNLLHLSIKYAENKGTTDGSIRMNVTTNLYSVIMPYFEKLFKKIVDTNKLIRKIGITFCELSKNEQYDFFTDQNKIAKEKNLTKHLIELQNKFGKNVVLKGIDFCENATQRERNKNIGGHNSE